MKGLVSCLLLSSSSWVGASFPGPVEIACEVGPGPAAIERKLLGQWQGGACQGNWVFRDNGTFVLDHYSPANLQLSGTWKMRWEALPPTLVTTFDSSVDSSYAGKKWELKLTQLDEQTLEFKSPGGSLSRCERSKK